MKPMICVAVLLTWATTVAEGQVRFHALQRGCLPTLQIAQSERGWREIADSMGVSPTRIDACFFGGFTPGGTDDSFEMARFERFVNDLEPDQQLFIRGTADGLLVVPGNAARDAEANTRLAEARARLANRRAGGRAVLLDPWIGLPATPAGQPNDWRGVWAYVATFDQTVAIREQSARVDSVIMRSTITVLSHDTVRVYDTTTVFGGGSGWHFGFGGGVSGLFTGGFSFLAPTLTVNVDNEGDNLWVLTLTGGYRPKSPVGDDVRQPFADPVLQFNKRTETFAAANVAYYPDRAWFGAAFGVQGAWENVREVDEYIERAYGLTLGPRVRLETGSHGNEPDDVLLQQPPAARSRARLVLGIDLQLSNLSEFTISGSRWRFGIAPSITLSYALR